MKHAANRVFRSFNVDPSSELPTRIIIGMVAHPTAFERFEMRSKMVCWDDRFMYLEQSMWKQNGDCASHVIYRAALTEKGKGIAPTRMAEALGQSPISPPMPEHIAAWVEAESKRPWPPMAET